MNPKKNTVHNVKQVLLELGKEFFLKNWGIKLLSFIIAILLWAIAQTNQF